MRRLRSALPLLAAVALLGLATVLLLFAFDVRAWQGTFTQGDLHFRARRSYIGLWRSPAVLPGDPARALLGLGDALAYRRGLQLFWLSNVGASTGGQADLGATRAAAETELQELTTTGASAEERSTAANLLGVLTVITPEDSATQKAEIATAKRYFTQAVDDDPTNYAPKLNLELVLRIQRPPKSPLDEDAHGGFGSGGANGAGPVGGGF
jgi:hypothetical protein